MASHPPDRRSRRNRRAQGAIAWGLILFVAAQVAFRVALDRRPELGDAEFGRKLADLRATVAANPGRPLILMLGSSRVATGFRPDALPRSGRAPIAFNFAQVGTGPEMAHLCLHRILDAGIRPDHVLIEYWPPSWTVDRSLREYLTQINVGGLDPGDVALLGRYIPEPKYLYRAWLPTQWSPLWANRSALLARYASGLLVNSAEPDHRCRNLDPSGYWHPCESVDEAERRRLMGEMRAHYAPRLARFQTRPTPDRALRAMLELCQRRRIRAALVVLPEGPEFRGWYPEAARAEVAAYLDRLRRECDVSVIDARDWVPESGFMDGHHLLPDGARRFTERLGREALPTILATAPTPRRE